MGTRGLRVRIGLATALAVAAALRLWNLDGEHLYGDEAEYAIVARTLAADWLDLSYPPLVGREGKPFVSQPPLVLYLMALAMRAFGATDVAAILPSALLGTATVAVVYAIGRRLGGDWAGLGAAWLLAVLPFHVEMSRRAMLDAGLAFFLALTAYALVAWCERPGPWRALAVGSAAAGAALTKLPGVLAVALALVVLAGATALAIARERRARPLVGALRDAAIAAAPLAAGALAYLALLAHRGAVDSLLRKLRWQLGRVEQGAQATREITAVQRDAWFYLTDPHFSAGALLGLAVVTLALVGCVAALRSAWRRRDLAPAVPALAFVLLGAFLLWSDRKEGFYLLPLAPFCAVLVVQAATLVGVPASHRVARGRGAVALAGLLVVAPAYDAAADSYASFIMGEAPDRGFGAGTREAALWIREHDPTAAQYGTLLGRFSLVWYNGQPTLDWYIDHDETERRIASGELRYVVYDRFLELPHERDHMDDIVRRYRGEVAATFGEGDTPVIVFRLAGAPRADE